MGTEESIKKARNNKKFLSRERIKLLLDIDSPFIELMPLAGLMHTDGFGPGGTTVAGLGYVNERLCIINSNIGTRKAGTVFAMISLGIGELIAACCIIITVFFGGEEGISGDRTMAPPTFGVEFISQKFDVISSCEGIF